MYLQSVVITGTNRGIGLEFVRQLLASTVPPKHLIATTRQSSNVELDKLKASHPSLHVLTLDTKNYKQYNQFVSEVQKIVGSEGIDTLINNAGIERYVNLDDVTPEDMIETFEVNSVAPLMLTKALLPLLKVSASKQQTIVVNITSHFGSIDLVQVMPNSKCIDAYPYRTSKVALNMVTKCLAVDLKEDGINVSAIHPGWVRTDLGGPNAMYDVASSVSNMITTIKSIDDSMSGKVVKFDGTVIPY